MYITKKIGLRLAGIPFVQRAIKERAVLEAFKEPPGTRVIIGIILILFSYAIGWPAVGLLAIIAVITKKPLIAVIGGPLIYGFSHIVFLVGMYLAGAPYAAVFLSWAARVGVEWMIGDHCKSNGKPN